MKAPITGTNLSSNRSVTPITLIHRAKIKFLVTVTFNYELRPDPFSEYRPGFEIRTIQRCSEIVTETHADADRKVRTYQFVYQGDTLNGVSLLNQIGVVGHDDDKNQGLPPFEFVFKVLIHSE
jgi:hypothetical protein